MHTLEGRSYWFPILLILVGAAMFLQRLHVPWAGWEQVLWAALAVSGGVKLGGALRRKSRGGIFWGLFWFVLGGALLLHSVGVVWLDPGIVIGGLFLVAGTGLVLMFLVSRRDWHLLVPGLCLLAVGCAILSTELGYSETWQVAPLVNRWWPAGLVLTGAALLARSARREA